MYRRAIWFRADNGRISASSIRFVVLLLIVWFTPMSTLAGSGLEIPAMDAPKTGSEYSPGKRWAGRMIAAAGEQQHTTLGSEMRAEGFAVGALHAEINTRTQLWEWGSFFGTSATFGLGTLILWKLAGHTQQPAEEAMMQIEAKSVEYKRGFVEGFQQKGRQEKRRAIKRGAVVAIGLLVVVALLESGSDL